MIGGAGLRPASRLSHVSLILAGFARAHDIRAAHFTAIGAFSDVTLGYF